MKKLSGNRYEFLYEREHGEDPLKYADGGIQYPELWTDRWENLYQKLKADGMFRKGFKTSSGKPFSEHPEVVHRMFLQLFGRGMDEGLWDAEIARAQAANKIHLV